MPTVTEVAAQPQVDGGARAQHPDRSSVPRAVLSGANRWGPPIVLAGLVALYIDIFGRLAWRQHSSWRSLGFDTGIYDQGLWLLSQGRDPFMTIRGMDYWGHHVAVIGYLFAPIYWLGGGVQAISLVHTIWVGAGAIPLWLLARDRWAGGSAGRWVALAVPVAYLLHPAVNWVTWWLFHPDSLAITPLLFAWWLARTGRWWWFALACTFAMACKEDVALAVMMMGLGLILSGRVRRHRAVSVEASKAARAQRVAGVLTVAAAAAWFLVASKVVIPLRNNHAPAFYESYFPTLGSSLKEILRNLVVHPSRAFGLVTRPRVPDYALRMLGPVGFVLPFLGPLGLLVAAPQISVNLLVEVQNGATIKSQYASLPLVGIFLGVVEGMAVLRRRPALLRAAAVWLVGCAIISSYAFGLAPFSRDFHGGVWAERPPHNLAELNRAFATVPPQGRVSASWNMVTHFTHRPIAYEFPNPWLSSNYGPSGNEVGDPTTVDWIVVEHSALSERDLALLARLTGEGGDFDVVSDTNDVTVARRAP